MDNWEDFFKELILKSTLLSALTDTYLTSFIIDRVVVTEASTKSKNFVLTTCISPPQVLIENFKSGLQPYRSTNNSTLI